jgi:preprotein translocase subunit SecF
MEIIIAIVIAAGVAIWYFNRDKGLDVNNDGKVDVKDLEVAVENTVVAVKEEVKVAKAAVKKTATKAKTTVKKAATKAKTTTKAATSTGAKRGPKPKTSV